ncbi:hypothetical protein OIU77_022643 [Salix suchowensis]|uniref:Uncharacterized protein n=1 Tax=Salix suchowensis TaxID=1278906 RepID=A0ABQ9C506_9ROSI|nr:hypothetical protein OIU77_022643 [Salix suchowensis]
MENSQSDFVVQWLAQCLVWSFESSETPYRVISSLNSRLLFNPSTKTLTRPSSSSPETGDHFCSGIDIKTLNSIANDTGDRGRSGERLRRDIKYLQEAITAIERCRKPVIAAITGACIGGGIDIVTACDIRYCSKDAFFSVKEVDMGINGGLRDVTEGLVSRVFGSKEELDEGVKIIAEGIAAKSPLAVTGTKAVLLRSRDSSVEQGLDYVATWNSSMLVSDDLMEAVSAHLQKRKPTFSKL